MNNNESKSLMSGSSANFLRALDGAGFLKNENETLWSEESEANVLI